MRKEFERYDAEYYLPKDWIFPYSEVEKASKIVLYGAGDVGQAYFEQIQHTNYCNVIKWIDKKFEAYEGLGMDVVAPSEILDCKYDYIVLAVSMASIAREISVELLELGVRLDKIVWIGNIRTTLRGTLIDRRILIPIRDRIKTIFKRRGFASDSDEVKSIISRAENRVKSEGAIILPRLVIELTPVCTLKCRGCNNLMPLYEKPKHVPKEEVLRDIYKVMGCIDGIVTVELLGGEPFAYPWLYEIVKTVIDFDCIKEVEITTNGTIVPNAEIIDLFKHNKVIVKVSNYGKLNYNVNIEEILLNSGIKYEIHNDLKWIDAGGPYSRKRSQEEIRSIYKKCGLGLYCKTLYRGRIYACARSASLHDLGICYDTAGYIDLYDKGDLKERIKAFWLKDYDEACDYCDYTDYWRVIPAGCQKMD